MSRTLVQISLLTLLVFASFSDAFAQRSAISSAGQVIGNQASKQMTVIKEPVARSEAVVSAAVPAQAPVRVTVMGQVSAPGVYEFRKGAPDLQELVTQAGNLTRFCGHQFFVFKANEESLKLDPRKDAGYKFEDGDILLAETSARYYRALGNQDQAATLAEIHPTTQIVLLNVLDRPVLLSLQPEQAKLSYLLSLLNQKPTSLVGRVEQIVPPNSSAIPADALIAPDMIFSGAILRFDPQAIDQSKLPHLPDPMLVKTSPEVRMASAERAPSSTGWSRDGGALMVQPVKSESQNPFAPNLGPTSEMSPATEAKPTGNPFDDAFAEFETTSEESLKSEAPEVLLPEKETTKERTRALLSAQQWRIIVTFVTLISLFLTAWYIRQRQLKRGLKTFNFVESHTATSPTPASDPPLEAGNSGGPADQPAASHAAEAIASQTGVAPAAVRSPADDAQDEILELGGVQNAAHRGEPGTRTAQTVKVHELNSYDSPRSEDYIDEQAFEISFEELGSGSEIQVFDQVETPREAAAEAAASSGEDLADDESLLEARHDEAESVIDELEQPGSRVQQTLLGTPWMQELSGGLDPEQSDVSLERHDEQPADAPAAEAEVKEAKPHAGSKPTSGRFAAQQLRIDQAHAQEPRPAIRPQAAETPREQALDKTVSGSQSAGRSEPPSAAAKWMKMADHPAQPEENLDHIFQAILRDRKK